MAMLTIDDIDIESVHLENVFTGIWEGSYAQAREHILEDWEGWAREPRRQLLPPPAQGEPGWICRARLTREADLNCTSLELAFWVEVESESTLRELISPILNRVDWSRAHKWSY